MFRLRSIVPRNTQNTQKFSSARKFCEFCGSTFQQEASVCSVNSVGRCNGCFVGALLALASGKAERRQVYPLELPPWKAAWVWQDAIPSYNSTDWEGFLKYLCASVPSVGGYFSKRFLWVLRILWEDAVAALLVQWRPLHPLRGCVGMAGMPYPPISAPLEEISSSTR